jgi:hypothetical protein
MLGSTTEELRTGLQAEVSQAAAQLETLATLARDTAVQMETNVAAVKPALAEAAGFLEERTGQARQRFVADLDQLIERAGARWKGETERACREHLAELNKKAQALADEAGARLETQASETRAQLETAAGTALAELHVTAKNEIEQSVREATTTAYAALNQLVNETRQTWSNRERESLDALAQAAGREAEEFRRRLEAVLNTTLTAAASAIREHSERLLETLAATAPKHGGNTESPEASSHES